MHLIETSPTSGLSFMQLPSGVLEHGKLPDTVQGEIMKFEVRKGLLLATIFVLVLVFSVTGFAQCGITNQIYCQPWDGGSTLIASQNDTNGLGNFATTYDNFTLTAKSDVESFHWYGGYFNGTQSAIDSWTLTFYTNNGGIPGSTISSVTEAGNANETLVQTVNGVDIFSYSLAFASINLQAGTYWASVVPTIGFPPQWGWATGTGGDGAAYQCFFGSCSATAGDQAFAIDGTSTPEPGTFVMLATGIFALAGAVRRKLA